MANKEKATEFSKMVEQSMAARYLSYQQPLMPGTRYKATALCLSAEERKTRNGFPCVSLLLSDGKETFKIDFFKYHTLAQLSKYAHIEPGDLIDIVFVAKDEISFDIEDLIKSVNQGDEEKDKYIIHTHLKVEDIFESIQKNLFEFVKSDRNSLANIAIHILDDNKEAFIKTPAAISYHQNYYGGLLEHTYHVSNNTRILAERYKEEGYHVDVELAFVGAILHDIGKIKEYSIDPYGSIRVTRIGNMFGHLHMGANMVEEEYQKGLNRKDKNKYDENLRSRVNLLEHIIVSHHGEKQYGAITEPAFLEAYLVHVADDMDAKLCYYNKATGKMKGTSIQSIYSNELKTHVINTNPVEEINDTDPSTKEYFLSHVGNSANIAPDDVEENQDFKAEDSRDQYRKFIEANDQTEPLFVNNSSDELLDNDDDNLPFDGDYDYLPFK